jgi:hypothetical protein
MKEEKDIQPIDKLFRQSLEGYSPAPPASVWKSIKAKKTGRNHSSGKWFTSPGGLSIISAVVLVASSWIIYKSFIAEPKNTIQNQSVHSIPFDSIMSYQPSSKEDKAAPDVISYAADNTTPDELGKSGGIRSESTNNPVSPKKSTLKNHIDQDNTIVLAATGGNSTNFIQTPPLVNSENTEPVKKDIMVLKSKENTSIQDAEIKVLSDEPDFIGAFVERSALPVIKSIPDSLNEKNAEPGKNITTGPGVKVTGNNPDTDPNAPDPASTNTKIMIGQLGIYGNIGQVYQNNRSTNLFYGGMITGGLWNSKWKAGLETGIGISKYKDYGSVENSWMTLDSIVITDTIWHQQDSITYFELIDSTVYIPIMSNDTVKYNYRYSYLQIPLLITKQIATFGKFSLDIKAGLVVGFMISKRETVTGSMPPDNVVVTSVNKNYTRLDLSWQLHFAPQIRWNITDKLSLKISPAAVFYLNNLYDKGNRPSSKPYGISIYGGVTYNFK